MFGIHVANGGAICINTIETKHGKASAQISSFFDSTFYDVCFDLMWYNCQAGDLIWDNFCDGDCCLVSGELVSLV